MNKAFGIIGLIWMAVCLFFAAQGGKKNRNPKYDRYSIILGIAVAGVISIGVLIAALFS